MIQACLTAMKWLCILSAAAEAKVLHLPFLSLTFRPAVSGWFLAFFQERVSMQRVFRGFVCCFRCRWPSHA